MPHMNGNGVTNLNGLNGQNTEDEKNKAFLKKVFDVLMEDGIDKGTSKKSKVVEFVQPEELKKKLDLHVNDDGDDDEHLLDICKKTIHYSVKTGHPHFFNQLYSGYDEYGLAGSWLTDTLNTSQYTFEVAPVFTLLEQVVLQKMRDIVGYKTGDGIFCPGGSISNMYGLNLARYSKFPSVKTDGMHSLPKLAMFTSAQSHYSIKKGAALLGFGVNNIHYVPCDATGKMNTTQLERMMRECIEKGVKPFFVNATSGTTVAGAYDPLDKIADLCEKYDCWMHVDCCWGGGVLLSRQHRHLMNGIERADSLAWNPHKMMGSPLQCCAFLTRHEDILFECHSANARYLFQQDKNYDVSYDTGDKSIQCGRKVDVFKLWMMWKAKGNNGFERGIDNAFANAKYLVDMIKLTKGFRLVFPEPECTNVCFWYIPPSLEGQEETKEWWQKVAKVAPAIKERMMQQGTMLIGYQPLGDHVNFFRMVVSNLSLANETMEFVISEIQRLGKDL